MKVLQVTISTTLQVTDTEDKLRDCLTAVDAAKKLLNDRPGYELLSVKESWNGAPLVSISKLVRASQGGVISSHEPPPPLSIDAQVEG
jgi:hypothetical protein